MRILYWSTILLFLVALAGCTTGTTAPDFSAWNKESGIRFSAAQNPFVLRLLNNNLRLYYVASSEIRTAVSTNEGATFSFEATCLSPLSGSTFEAVIANPCVMQESLTSYRMYYEGLSTTESNAIHRIFTAISSDGLTFVREGTALTPEVTGDLNSASSPFVLKLADSSYRLYYVSKTFMIKTPSLESTSGQTFQGARTAVWGSSYDDAAVSPQVKSIGSSYKLFYATDWKLDRGGPTKIMSATSADGLTFTEDGKVLIGLGTITDTYLVNKPSVILLTNGNYRMFYAGTTDGTTYNLLSATKEAAGI